MHNCTYRPFLRFLIPADDNAGGGSGGGAGGGTGGGGDNSQQSSQSNQNPEDRGYPQGVPVDDMSVEQRAAYHAYHSRKHENRVKAFGDWTPEKIRALEEERDKLRTAGQTDSQREIEQAREAGREEVRAELNRERATRALEKALQGRVPDASALLGLDVSRFVVNGSVDQEAVTRWVDDNSTQVSTQRQKIDVGGGRRGSGGDEATKSVAAGRDVYADRRARGAQKSTS